jgi:hypothetical protein
MLFWKEHTKENKCLKCGKLRYVEVINDDAKMVTTEVAHKQLRYIPITPRLKGMFLSKRTAIHIRWHKDGVRENRDVMVHPSDSDIWKALDNFDPEFARDVRNLRIGLATDGFTPFGGNATPYSCWLMFVVPYNLPPSLCMKYEIIFPCVIIPGPDHLGSKLNVMLKPLIDELKEFGMESKLMTLTRSQNSHSRLHICGRFMISWPTIFCQMEHSWAIDLSDMLLRH